MFTKNAHCSYCGAAFDATLNFPRRCRHCQNTTYINPLPVVVLLLPIDDGLLMVRRNIEPQKDKLALPGGYINVGEDWQEAAVRELFEETGVKISASEVELFNVLSAPDNTLLIFGKAKPHAPSEFPEFKLSEETSECVVVKKFDSEDMAFPLHALVVEQYCKAKD